MKSLLICVIILTFNSGLSVSLTSNTNDYYIEDYCKQEFVSLSPEESVPIKLSLSRQQFDKSYCFLIVNTTENNDLEVRGLLGQLVLNHNKTDNKRLHFIFNSSLTEDKSISMNIFGQRLIIIVENNENAVKFLDKKLLETSLVFSVLKREEDNSWSDSDSNSSSTTKECKEYDSDPNCGQSQNSFESSGDLPPIIAANERPLCSGNACNVKSEDNYEEESSEPDSGSDSGSDSYSEEQYSDDVIETRAEMSISGSNGLVSNKSFVLSIAWIWIFITCLSKLLQN